MDSTNCDSLRACLSKMKPITDDCDMGLNKFCCRTFYNLEVCSTVQGENVRPTEEHLAKIFFKQFWYVSVPFDK